MEQDSTAFIFLDADGASFEDLKEDSPDRAVQRAEFWELVESCLKRLPKKPPISFGLKKSKDG